MKKYTFNTTVSKIGGFTVALAMVFAFATPAIAQTGGDVVTAPTNGSTVGMVVVVDRVVNDNGGTRIPSNFTVMANGVNVTNQVFAGSEDGTAISFGPGAYTIMALPVAGYVTTPLFECSGTVTAGGSNLCIMNHDDVPGFVLGADTGVPAGMPITGTDADANPFSTVVLWVFLSFIVSAGVLAVFEGKQEIQ